MTFFVLLGAASLSSEEPAPPQQSREQSTEQSTEQIREQSTEQVRKPSIQLVQAGQVNGLDSKLDSELDGAWEHCWYVRFTDPGSLEPNLDSGWKPATVPGYLTDIEGYNQDVDEIWYLKEFRIQGELSHSLSLRLGRIDDRDRVYLNGVLIGSSGQWDSSVASAYDRIRIYEIPAGLLHKDRPNTILVHVQGYFPGINGMVRGRTEIGPSSELARTLRDEDYGELIFLTGYFTAGSYFLFLFLRRRQNRENLLFALFIYGFVLRQLIRTELRFETDISFLTFKRLEFVLTYLLFVVFLYFVRTYFDYRKNLTTTISDALSAAISGIMVILSVHVLFSDDMRNWWTLQKYVGQPLWLVMLLQVIFLQIRAARQENRDALYMLGGMFFVMIGFFSDLAVSNGYLNIPPLFSYFFAAFIFSLALILANRFVRLYRTVEDLNKNLERKVQDRTEKLNNTLGEVQVLKEKQDGDYFLTSLLMNPLGGNWATGQDLDTDILLEQKKKFHFRKWDSEIGGDLVALYDIELRNKKYTVFLNADAMGKSMQGAGGAIVVGTVFKSMVTRTQVVASASDKSPEQWLNECFLELQSVFLGFDGHMLISAVLGLVHDETGTVYYINAEHPATVLYEDGRADFMDDLDFGLRKIGIDLEDSRFRVLVHKLNPGQILIMGSDGRDDLLLGESEEGQRIINEDEKLFLRIVEESGGDLAGIRARLLERGELTDDLSLIRIAYTADVPALRDTGIPGAVKSMVDEGQYAQAYEEIQKLAWDVPSVLQAAAWLAGKLNEADTSAMLYRRLVQMDPATPLHLFRASLACKKSGRLKEAIDYGERCRLRIPDHARNLVNLADCYRLMGQTERSSLLARKALSLEPDLVAARTILERLQS